MIDQKYQLRQQALEHRDRIRPEDEDIENAVALFHAQVPLKDGQVVAAYWPIGKEFDVRYIIDDLLKKNITIALPVTNNDSRIMQFSKWDGKTDLVKAAHGTFVPAELEVVEPDILLVPFLAFDRKGNRLGRGGGYYDATLESLRLKREILAIGVGYAAQAVLFNLPIEEHDQRLDMVITSAGVHDFRS